MATSMDSTETVICSSAGTDLYWNRAMIIGLAVFSVVMVVGMKHFLEYRDWLDWNKDLILKNTPGPCVTVIESGGSEDLIHIGNNIVLISRGLNFRGAPGFISALDLNDNSVTDLNITNSPDRADFLAGPHGLTTWKDHETGQLYLFVLTHPLSGDCVEVFEVDKILQLKHVRTISDPSFTFMNDLVAVGKDQFYITSVLQNIGNVVKETYLRRPNGRIVYYDGLKGREVASGYFMANGINMSPDNSIIYMAESGYKTLHAFKRDESNNLKHLWAFDTGTVLDNIDVDPDTGDLLIGCQPILWKAFDFFGMNKGNFPSQVIRVKIRDDTVSEIEEIYADDGREIERSTIATYVNGKLVIGSVSDSTLVCDMNYRSP